ncbi:MAG: ABC transporter substrate-binding protein [Chloroflexi bacterium]|nr:ABC transporter substrate-binding protein [Chloroflexota bacterium]
MRRGISTALALLVLLGLLVSSACQPSAPAPEKKAEAPKAVTKTEAPKAETKAQAPKAETKTEPPKTEAKKAEAPKAEKPEVSKIRLGTIPIAPLATMLVADKLGYFKDEGLTYEATSMAGGAVSLPAVTAGKLEFAYAAFPSIPLGRSEGFDYVVVVGGNSSQKTRPDAATLFVAQDGPIKSLKDLEGKRIAINVINSINWLYVREFLDKNGIDPKKVNFVEIGFPQMADLLANKQVDAVFNTEPFTTIMNDSGKFIALAYPYVDVQPGTNIAHWVASEKWVKANPITTRKFARAITRAIDYLNASRDEQVKFIAEYTKGDVNLLKKATLDLYVAKADVTSLQNMTDLMLKHGMLKQKVDIAPFIWETAK